MKNIARAFLFSQGSGAENLALQDIPLPAPAAGEVQIEHTGTGANYLDIYHRKGVSAPKQQLPNGSGMEGVGIITAIGSDVTGFHLGDRIANAVGPLGGRATHRNVPAGHAIKVPGELDSETVAAIFFKRLTAEHLVHPSVAAGPGETVLFHAVAGGIGSIACQWLKAGDVTVIGTVSSREKAEVAPAYGCDEVIRYTEDDFRARVVECTGGHGVFVAFESFGADIVCKSPVCLRSRGTLVSFGESSVSIAPLNVALPGTKGSLFVTRPSVAHYTTDRDELEAATQRVFAANGDGTLRAPRITQHEH